MGSSCANTAPSSSMELPPPTPSPRFNPFYSASLTSAHSLAQYKFHSNYEDRFLGRCNIIQEETSGNLYLCKEVNVGKGQGEYAKVVAKLKEKMDLAKGENLIQIKDIVEKDVDGFIFDSKKVLLIVDYPLINLSKEFSNRILNSLIFSREQLLNILYSCIRGYAILERAGYLNDKVRLKNIFVGIKNKESLIKVIDGQLLAEERTNFQCSKDGVMEANKDVYLSPEELEALRNGMKVSLSHKNGVFSLGMSMLDLALMDPSRSLYHSNYSVDQKEIKAKIAVAGKVHGPILQRFLIDMLTIDDSKRLTFSQLQAKIPNLFAQQRIGSTSMRCSVLRSQNSQFIQSDTKSLRNSRVSNRSLQSRISASPSRVFASSIKIQKQEQTELDNIHEQYTNGNTYIGQKKGNLKQGRGKYIFKDKSYYEGAWRNNKMEGKGQLYSPTGQLEYSGEWKGDEFDGWGTEMGKDGESWIKYEGDFRKGQREGRGKMSFKNGVVYDGEFRGGKIQGRGRRVENGVITEKVWDPLTPGAFAKIGVNH